MGEARLRADLVVGGLWEGAPVDDPITPDERFSCVWLGPRKFARVHAVWRIHAVTAPVYLRLDDPLGLGLAVLAARVARRLAEHDRSLPDPAADGLDAFEDHIEGLAWYPFMAAGRIYGHGRYITEIASTYLALTDRLCAAVGLTLAPDEVARWERPPVGWGGMDTAWRLVTQSGAHTFDAAGATDPSDWQAALEAAIAEVARG